jgi:hypothetical protein
MIFIENQFASEEELTKETAQRMVDEILIISQSYDSLALAYEFNRDRLTERKIKTVKALSFHMRG